MNQSRKVLLREDGNPLTSGGRNGVSRETSAETDPVIRYQAQKKLKLAKL